MPENLSMLQIAFSGLALTAALGVAMWIASLICDDVSLVDRVWSIFIVGAGIVYMALAPEPWPRGAWMIAIGGAWALRLSGFITWRNWGEGEERRYQEIRKRNDPNFRWKSLYLVFALQAVLAWVVSAPFLVGATSGARPMNWIDAIGIAIAVFGAVFEAVGDAQMARFKADPAHKGQVMDRGLWRYTRHPNYFGEVCVWWGLWLVALGGAGLAGAWSVVSPLLMTVLLLKVSGVSLQEKDIGERRPAYRDYIERTNAFVPGPRRERRR